MVGSSYIPTLKWLKVKRCAVNIENFDDNQCFKWSILACPHEAKTHKERLWNYKAYKNELNFDGIEFPVHPKSIPQFESQNPHLSINVVSYEAENRGFCVLFASPHHYRRPHTVNLLLLDDQYGPSRLS